MTPMKGILTATVLTGLIGLPAFVQAGQAPSTAKRSTQNNQDSAVCDNRAPRVRAVRLVLPDPFVPIQNTVDHSGSATNPDGSLNGDGKFDPIPLLETKIFVGGKKNSCVIAHFSAEFNTGDNRIVFQASIDDEPMEGHAFIPSDLRSPQLETPIVYDQSRSVGGFTLPAMAAYNFFKIVKPGWHTVKIKWAGCCSADPTSVSAEVLAAVMTLEYQGQFANYERDDD